MPENRAFLLAEKKKAKCLLDVKKINIGVLLLVTQCCDADFYLTVTKLLGVIERY